MDKTIAVDVETKRITAYEVMDEQVHDNKEFKDLVEKSQEKARVKRVLLIKHATATTTLILFHLCLAFFPSFLVALELS